MQVPAKGEARASCFSETIDVLDLDQEVPRSRIRPLTSASIGFVRSIARQYHIGEGKPE